MDTITTILKYGHNKSCMLILVDSYQGIHKRTQRASSDSDGVIVYETDLARGLKAYFSVQGRVVELSSGDTVELNQLYADKLGLKEETPLLLRRIKSTVARAKHVQVEPVSVDDWEILENNAGHVEMVLLDQVRVVWKGQILPVWIMKRICVYLKISNIEPSTSCVILENNTEIAVAPKMRTNIRPPSLSLPAKLPSQYQTMNSPSRNQSEQLSNSSEYDNIDILEPRPTVPSPSKSPRSSVKINAGSRPISFIGKRHSLIAHTQRQSSLMENIMKHFFPTGFIGEKKEIPDNLSDSDRGSFIDFSMKDLPSRNGVLRVQPMTLSYKLEECFSVSKQELNKQILSVPMFGFRSVKKPAVEENFESQKHYNIPLEVFQPSTVYVDAEYTKNERLIHPYLPHLPNSFIARLQRLPSPQEKAMAAQKVGKKLKTSNTGSVADSSQGDAVDNLDSIPSGSATAGGTTSVTGSCYVRVVAIDRKAGLTDNVWQKAADQVLSNQPLLYGHVIIPDLLRRQLRLETTGSVWIQTGTIDLVIPRKINMYLLSQLPKKIGNDMVILAFTNYIKQCANEKHPLVVFQGIFLKFVIFPETHAEVQLTFFGENDPGNAKAVTMLSELNIDHVQITIEREGVEDQWGVINTLLPYCQTIDFDAVPFPTKLKHLGGVDSLVQQALMYLHASLASRPLSRYSFKVRGGLSHGILLITGPRGSGKSSLVQGLCRKMAHLPILAHVAVVDCKALRGKAVSTIQNYLEMVFDDAAWREPTVVVLENLDVIVPAPSGPETELTGESLYSAKNAQVLEGVIRYEIENNSCVTVLATSTSRSSLHPNLTSARGMHCIQQTLNIDIPDKNAREKILVSILQKHKSLTLDTVNTLDLAMISLKTEGYVARDLELLVNRTLHQKMSEERDDSVNKVTLNFDDFEETLSTFKPVSVRNVPLHKPGDLSWIDVGGLSHVKKGLIETLRWPTKYSKLFSSCPLRLRSGILLYGAPGTGKTLLAGVVAKECGLNFISVKGPELLNKYIGASEQAVRDLFTKAQSAKPCILFFDEFDSIAPKRGHDSTGVTDRVVNQFLTQLDGVEGLQGVYVLAATSRPDLIDPALLRPGRLDISLYCGMPDEEERCDILQALTQKMSLATDVNLKEVAAVCEHFTGADLKALLYNAQLKVIHEETDGDRSLNEKVLWIKGDSNQSGTRLRRASVIKDEAGAFRLSLSKSISGNSFGEKSAVPGDLQSPRVRSHSLDHYSPQALDQHSPQRKIICGNRTPRSPLTKNESDNGDVNVVDLAARQNGRGERASQRLANIFQYPSPVESNSVEAALVIQDLSQFDETGGERLRFQPEDNDSGISSVTPLRRRSSESLTSVQSKSEPDDPTGESAENIFPEHLQDALIFKDSHEAFSSLSNLDQAAEKVVETELASIDMAATSMRQEIVTQDSSISDLDNVRTVNISRTGSSEAPNSLPNIPDADGHSTNHRKRRERARSRGNVKTLTRSKPGMSLDSSSLERPVTVFTSLKSGLATLSPEDEARYLAMIKEIQQRDSTLFEEANNKRRTSLQLESRLSVLMEVCHVHLMDAAKSMRPSVSSAERERYMKIYEKFVSSRKVGFDKTQNTTSEKRATLA